MTPILTLAQPYPYVCGCGFSGRLTIPQMTEHWRSHLTGAADEPIWLKPDGYSLHLYPPPAESRGKSE